MAEWFEKLRLGDLPALAAKRYGEREALCYGDQRWNYAEFDAEVDRVARGLIGIGVAHGEHVALWMVNRPEWLFLMYATAKIGAVLVPLNTRYRTADVAYTVRQSDSATWISMARSGPVDYLAMVRENLPDISSEDRHADFPKLRRVVLLGDGPEPGMLSWDDLLAAGETIGEDDLARRAEAVDPDDVVIIGYTSGTTGHPKGVMHSHVIIRNVVDRINRFGITFSDSIINNLPMFHLYGYSESAMLAILSGARQILMESFDAAETLRLVEAEGATIIHGFDTHYKDMLDCQARDKRDLSSLRFGTFPSGMQNSIPIARRSQLELAPTVSGWGMSETWAFTACCHANSTEEQRCEASGFPMPGLEFRIVDPADGRELPTGEQGELLVRGYQVMKGYYNKPEETAAAIDKEGWMHTGDTALIRPDGHIRFIGRFKDMLKVGGENVSPAEVEAYLLELPEIDQVAIVGYPDPRLAEVPVAFIVPSEGANVSLGQVAAHSKGNIASYKIPRHIICVSELPMTPTGKVQKHKLRAQALQDISAD
ncbi:MAG: AMP-binding protein [Rhodospirillaceae bacterium]|nr:AMP-binding protein [Rhodospirillaceae bacterium]